jgi:hypothetical protein
MKTWIIASILLGMLVIGGFAVVSALSDNAKDSTTIVSKSTSCSTCGNECNAQSNCGLSTCGAVSGTGSCGCGNK